MEQAQSVCLLQAADFNSVSEIDCPWTAVTLAPHQGLENLHVKWLPRFSQVVLDDVLIEVFEVGCVIFY